MEEKESPSEIKQLKNEFENVKNHLDQVITEYADYRKESDEIYQEYEETIQLLSDSLEKVIIPTLLGPERRDSLNSLTSFFTLLILSPLILPDMSITNNTSCDFPVYFVTESNSRLIWA